jgi:hypothetical protein
LATQPEKVAEENILLQNPDNGSRFVQFIVLKNPNKLIINTDKPETFE